MNKNMIELSLRYFTGNISGIEYNITSIGRFQNIAWFSPKLSQ